MKDYYARVMSIIPVTFVASFLLMVSPGQSLAQRGGPGATAAGRRLDTLNRQGEQYERDNLGRERKGRADAPGGRRAQDLAGQVKRDFEGLQAGYNKIVLVMASGSPLDYDSVFNSVAEVRKCAAGLRDNLALPRAKDDEGDKARSGAGDARIEESLLMLRKHIYSFVTNPMFEAPAAINVEQAGKAGRDLDMILELSEGIRRSSGRPK